MAELIFLPGSSSEFDASPYLEENGYTVKKVNIYDEFTYTDKAGNSVKPIVGYRYVISVKLSSIPEENIATMNAALSNVSIPVTFSFPDSDITAVDHTVTANFNRPDISVTAVRRFSDGVYWDDNITLVSEDFYSDDCL
jgi:hypothetical protein